MNVLESSYRSSLNNPLRDSTYQWAEIYYLSVCQGNYTSDGVTKTATSCFKNPSPQSLFNLQRVVLPWAVGIAFTGFDLFLLLFFCGGKVHWNGWMMFFLFVRLPLLYLFSTCSPLHALLTYNFSAHSSHSQLAEPLEQYSHSQNMKTLRGVPYTFR
jgi:hypothetical protein